MFKFKFENIEIEAEEKELKFIDGYAVLTKTLDRAECWKIGYRFVNEVTIKGIINRNLEIVIPPDIIYEDIEIFLNGNFMVRTKFLSSQTTFEKVLHYRGTEVIKEFDTSRYKIIDRRSVIINSKKDEIGIYNLEKAEFISESFTSITGYKKVNNITVLEAAKSIGKQNMLLCYIDLQGRIRSDVYSTLEKKYYNVKQSNIRFRKLVVEQEELLYKKAEKNQSAIKLIVKSIK